MEFPPGFTEILEEAGYFPDEYLDAGLSTTKFRKKSKLLRIHTDKIRARSELWALKTLSGTGIAPEMLAVYDKGDFLGVEVRWVVGESPVSFKDIHGIWNDLRNISPSNGPDHIQIVSNYINQTQGLLKLAGMEEFSSHFENYRSPSAEVVGFVHGDLHLYNGVKTDDRTVLIDWEFAGVGDPNYDLAYLSLYGGGDTSLLSTEAVKLWVPTVALVMAGWFVRRGVSGGRPKNFEMAQRFVKSYVLQNVE